MYKKIIVISLIISASLCLLQVQAKQVIKQNKPAISQRGCCSWHDGVCGCSGHGIQCCDGTQSPSCRCLKDFKNENKADRGAKS